MLSKIEEYNFQPHEINRLYLSKYIVYNILSIITTVW